MSLKERVEFLELYEARLKEYHILTILKDNLTSKGAVSRKNHDKWLKENNEKYCSLLND